MTNTVHNAIPLVPEGTLDPAAGLNLSLVVVDNITQVAVISFLNAPPGSPANGDQHIIDTVPTGVWVGHAGQLATWLDGAYIYQNIRIAVNLADSKLWIRVAAGWVLA